MTGQTKFSGPERWTARRKAEIAGAISQGLLNVETARDLYAISEDELQSWQSTLKAEGVTGLRVLAQERRTGPRRSIDEPATAILHDHTRCPCTITNISEHGAAVRFHSGPPPRTFILRCERTKRSSWATAVWREGQNAGVRFASAPATDATVEAQSGFWLIGEI